MEYPCGQCNKEVSEDEKAIQCEGLCQLWYHCVCVGMDDREYECLSSSENNWECSTCKTDLPAFNSVDAIDVFHFDFQKNLPTPKLTVGQQFYCRLLWTYLFGIYSASTKIMMAYMWHELLAKRKANDVISCLAHFIFSTRLGRTGAKWSIWWSDNCPGQNKNNVVMWFFSDLIRRQVYSRIDFKFMVPGHTYGPTDRHFATIEKYCSKIETVYIPQEWYEHVREAIVAVGSKIDVVEMEQDKFRNYRDHLKKLYVARNKDMDGIPLDFAHATWFNFGRGEKLVDGKLVVLEHPNEVWVRHTYDVLETPQSVSFMKKRGIKDGLDCLPPPLYDRFPIPIKKAKADDVRILLTKYIPASHQDFYSELPVVDADGEDSD